MIADSNILNNLKNDINDKTNKKRSLLKVFIV